MSSELSYEGSDEASENELLERSLSVWRGWTSIEWDDFSPTALDFHTACSIGHYDWVRTIIQKGDELGLDRRNRGGWTPLMYASYIGHDNIVNLLLSAGCNMNIKNNKGHTPLMLAASCGNDSVARSLVRRGAELELMDRTGWTALFHATYAGHQNFVAFLLEAGANKDAVEPGSGSTPLMEAAAEGHEIIVQFFLQHGVHFNAKAYNGDTARSLALLNGHVKIVSLIDNHILALSRPKSVPEVLPLKQHQSLHNLRLHYKGPSIQDGPEAIAKMIGRTRSTETRVSNNLAVPKGYVSFPVAGGDKDHTKMSYRDVTSPINPEDYKDSSGSRMTSEVDDTDDDGNAFTKTGAITIKSSSSSSGGLMGALGLSHEGSLDSDDSQSYDPPTSSSDDLSDAPNNNTHEETFVASEYKRHSSHQNGGQTRNHVYSLFCETGSSNCMTNSDGRPVPNDSPIKKCSVVECPVKCGVTPTSQQNRSATPDSLVVESVLQEHSDQFRETSSSSDTPLSLPSENMSQVEIVKRFLRNLTNNNPESRDGEKRWAENHLLKTSEFSCIPNGPGSSEMVGDSALEQKGPSSSSESVGQSGKLTVLPEHHMPTHDLTHHLVSDDRCVKNKTPLQNFNDQGSIWPAGQHLQPDLGRMAHLAWADRRQLLHHHPFHSGNQLHNDHSPFSDLSSEPRAENFPLPATLTSATQPKKVTSLPVLFSSIPKLSNHLYQNMYEQGLNPTDQFTSTTHVYSSAQLTSSPHVSPTAQLTSSPQVYPRAQPTSIAHVNPAAQLTSSPHIARNTPSPNPWSHMTNSIEVNTGQPGATPQNLPSSSGYSPAPVLSTGHLPRLGKEYLSMHPRPISSEWPKIPLMDPGTNAQPPVPKLPSSPATIIIPGHVTSQLVSNTIGWEQVKPPEDSSPRDLAEMLEQLGLSKYMDKFLEQDVDLQVFLSLTDNDLKELGIKLFGPRKKMANAIARWHSNAPVASSSLERAYADKLEAEMQEMAVQLSKVYENEERLKAQVLQEQQLRSVTESCLMEERASWDQAQEIWLAARSKIRLMGDNLSRLR